MHESNIAEQRQFWTRADKEAMFIVNLDNKLDIDDVDMYVLTDKNLRQLVFSYKT